MSAISAASDIESAQGLRVLVFTTLFPNPVQPRLGIFVRDRVRAVAEHWQTSVVAPVLRRPGGRLRHREALAVPKRELQGKLEVHHPRFFTAPGFGRWADGVLLFLQTVGLIRRLHLEWNFDLIDAHYAFPDGMAAVLLGRRFQVPVCVTLRGGDIDLLPKFRARRSMIRWTLRSADRLIAVSDHLSRGAVTLGAPPGRIAVIPNGIDGTVFRPRASVGIRGRLGIGDGQPLLICVGNLLAEKGQHVLLDAFALLGDGTHLALIGSDQWGRATYGRLLERRTRELGVQARVHMIGSLQQTLLADWYNAADLLVLPTFREGCPNVVREALACGTPVVASNVGGVPELIGSDAVGILVEPGDPAALARAIERALRRTWDRTCVAAAGASEGWGQTGLRVMTALRALVDGVRC